MYNNIIVMFSLCTLWKSIIYFSLNFVDHINFMPYKNVIYSRDETGQYSSMYMITSSWTHPLFALSSLWSWCAGPSHEHCRDKRERINTSHKDI